MAASLGYARVHGFFYRIASWPTHGGDGSEFVSIDLASGDLVIDLEPRAEVRGPLYIATICLTAALRMMNDRLGFGLNREVAAVEQRIDALIGRRRKGGGGNASSSPPLMP